MELLGVLMLAFLVLGMIIIIATLLVRLISFHEYEAYLDDDTEGYINSRR